MALYRQIDFNKGSVLDKMGATPTITGATFSKMEKGQAIVMSNNQYVTYSAQLLPNNAFSVVVWAKLKSTHIIATDGAYLIPSAANSNIGISLSYLSSPGRVIMILNATGQNTATFDYVPDYSWHCYIITIPGSAQTDINSATLTVDGVSISRVSSVSTGAPIARSTFVYLGSASGTRAGCHISKLKVYDTVLTSSEQTKEYQEFLQSYNTENPTTNFEYPKPTDLSQFKGTGAGQGLIAAYNMIPNGSTLVDISGNGYTGTIAGVLSSKDGMSFNGVNSKVQFTNAYSVASPFTISGRIKTSGDVTVEQTLFGSSISITNNLIIQIHNGSLKILTYNGTEYRASAPIVVNSTFDFEATWDGTSTLKIYLNGSLSSGVSGANHYESAGTTRIGSHNADLYFYSGEVIDFKIYNRVWTQAEITSYHNSFVKPVLIEDFSNYPVGVKANPQGTGVYTIGERALRQGDLVTNGNMALGDPNSTGYSFTGGTRSKVTGNGFTIAQRIDCPITTNTFFEQNITPTIGSAYRFSFKYRSNNGLTFYMAGVYPYINLSSNTGDARTYSANIYIKSATALFRIYVRTSSGDAQAGDWIEISDISLTEIPPLPSLTTGSKELVCGTIGNYVIPSKQAYGTWEFDWYKATDANEFSISFCNAIPSTTNALTATNFKGYIIAFGGNERFVLAYNNLGTLSYLFYSATSYIVSNTWYHVKVTRTTAGVFTLLIKGGSLVPTAGYDGYTLAPNTSGTGTNPVTNNDLTNVNYLVFNSSVAAGDKVSGIQLTNGIKQ